MVPRTAAESQAENDERLKSIRDSDEQKQINRLTERNAVLVQNAKDLKELLKLQSKVTGGSIASKPSLKKAVRGIMAKTSLKLTQSEQAQLSDIHSIVSASYSY